MSELALTHLRQARSFARAGEPGRAVELLEKARLLSRGDIQLQLQVLAQLAESYDAVGRVEQAARCRDHLSRLSPPAPMSMSTPPPMIVYPVRTSSSSRALVYIAAACVLVLFGIVAAVVVWNSKQKPRPLVYGPSTETTVQAVVAPATAPPTIAALPPPPPAVSKDPAPALPASTLPPPPKPDRQQALKETVGLIVVVLHYEGPTSNGNASIDIPLATGTSFAISSSGLMLTNRHVVDAPLELQPPLTLSKFRLPNVTLRDTSFVICFGPDPSDRSVAKLLHKSDQFDMAILKIDRHFDHPLVLASKELRQGDEIWVCGYPGIVMAAMNQASATPAKIVDVSRKWQSTRHVEAFDDFSAESFNSTLTKGIVSAPERNVKGVGYMQIDAVISSGNSGGPVLNTDNEVVGIATWGLRSSKGETATASYNFALLVGQLQPEIHPYAKE